MPTRGVGILLKRLDAPLIDCDQMRESGVERCAALFAVSTIMSCHQQAAVGEIEKAVRLSACLEMPGYRAPAVAPHRGGTFVVAADAERHSLSGAAGEIRMQQGVELIAVASGERGIEGAGEIGGAAAFHPKSPSFKPVVTGASSHRPAQRLGKG